MKTWRKGPSSNLMRELNGGTGENENRLRLDRMSDVIQGMIALTLGQGKMHDRQHQQVMTEIKAQRAENAERHARFEFASRRWSSSLAMSSFARPGQNI